MVLTNQSSFYLLPNPVEGQPYCLTITTRGARLRSRLPTKIPLGLPFHKKNLLGTPTPPKTDKKVKQKRPQIRYSECYTRKAYELFSNR